MVTIWKFPFTPNDIVDIKMPEYSNILTVQMQGGDACIWALVETKERLINRQFKIFATGQDWKEDNPLDWKYIGTFQPGIGLVFHLFEYTPF